jgi:hypothetical protein
MERVTDSTQTSVVPVGISMDFFDQPLPAPGVAEFVSKTMLASAYRNRFAQQSHRRSAWRSQSASPLLIELGVVANEESPNSELPSMSPKREPRFWTRENAPLIILGVGLVLVLIAAGILLWVINVAPFIP